MAADPHDEGGVKGRVSLLATQPQPIGEPGSDDGGPQYMLGRLTQPQVDRDRQRGEHIDAAGRARTGDERHDLIVLPAGPSQRTFEQLALPRRP